MKSLRFSRDTNIFIGSILDKYKKKNSSGEAFVTWILVWYFGSSILLLLSLHSYYMGFGK
tara:strand:- start:172 stop:351 length:180 start_codon:yes stop_codon:yes gene_type:complete